MTSNAKNQQLTTKTRVDGGLPSYQAEDVAQSTISSYPKSLWLHDPTGSDPAPGMRSG